MMNKMIGLRIVVLLILICLMILPTAFAETELAKGSKGVEVSIIQSWLNLLGYDVGTADGDFGNATYEAVVQFQTDKGLEATGTVDIITRAMIRQCLESIGDEYYIVNNGDRSGNLLYGFANQKGEIVIPCEWESVIDFSEGLAGVKKDGDWGYINVSGELVIPCEWYSGAAFSEGLARVSAYSFADGRSDFFFGYINASGELVIPCEWKQADSFENGVAAVRNNYGAGYIDYNGENIIPILSGNSHTFSEGLGHFNVTTAESNNKFKHGSYYINSDGDVVIYTEWFNAASFSEGLAWVKDGSTSKSKYGYIDTTGELVIPCIWDGVQEFHEGLARVEDGGKYGYIDATGELVIPCIWDDAWIFSEGLARVEDDGKWGFIDKTGSAVIECEWDYVGNFTNGLAAVAKDEKYGCINASGELVIPCEWDNIGSFSRQYASATREFQKYWINRNGEIQIDAGFDKAAYDKDLKKSQQNAISYEQMAANCIKLCKSMAKDPSSIQVHGIKYFKQDDNYVFVLDVTGTNSFGGASRQTFACFVNPDTGAATYNSIMSEISYSMYVGSTVNVSAAMALVK